MTNEEILISMRATKDLEHDLNKILNQARQDEREKVLKAFADWLDGEGFPVPDRKLQEYIKYNL